MEAVRATYRAVREAGCALRFHLAPMIGRKPLYEIAPGYRHRDRVNYFDDTENADEWQREVYQEARAIMLEQRLRTVTDVGCGSGFKLVHILGEFDTTGVDLPETTGAWEANIPTGSGWAPPSRRSSSRKPIWSCART